MTTQSGRKEAIYTLANRMMKEKSLIQNIIFNVIKTLNSILFPIITFSYSARILGVDGVGRVNFVKSVITYFTMIAMLGMNYYGTREAAKLKNDKEKLSRFCIEMLLINSCTTLLAYLMLGISMLVVPHLYSYRVLLMICSVSIVLQGMGMEWLYQAMEEYRYIAIRSVLFQIGALIIMFFFVRNAGDIIPYTVVTVLASSGSYILNFINARKYIRFDRHLQLEIKKHLKPLLWLFAMAVSIEMFTVLDSLTLGFLKGDTAVGLYTAAVKVERMVNTLITSIGVVLIPRLSYYIGQGEYKKTSELVCKAYNYTFMLSIPAAVGLFMLSNDIILLFSGKEFASAGFTMKIMTPIVILIPFSVATNQQTLVPMKKEKLILISTLAGAGTNLTFNMLLIPHFSENGAAAATVLAEIFVAAISMINARRFFDMKKNLHLIWQYWLAAMSIPVVVWLIKRIPIHYVLQTVLSVGVCCTLYFLILLLMGNPYTMEVYATIGKKLSQVKERFNK